MVNSQNLTKLLLSISAAALMIGCSTSIAERSPFDIASNSLRRTDSYSGVSEVLAPQIKAFSSSQSSVKGQMQLRTAGPFTDAKGKVHEGGAYLEILMNYATATPDPDGGLFFDQAVWPGGEVAELADFGASVLDCQEDVREIYRVPIGYSGYGQYGGHYGQYGRRHGGYSSGRYGRRGGYNSYGRHVGSGRRGGHTGEHRGDDHVNDGTASEHIEETPQTGTNRTHTGGRPRTGVTRRDREEGGRMPRERDAGRTGTNQGTATRGDRPVKRPHRSIPRSTIKENMSRRTSSPETRAAAPSPAAAPVSRPAPQPTSRPAPRSESRPSPKKESRPSRNTSRSTDRAFKNTNNARTRSRSSVNTKLRYDPRRQYNPGYTDYSVNYSCDRQESIRIFIPRDRLMAAEKSGLLVYLRPQNGLEETIALPPNYISGFLLAAYSPDGQNPEIVTPMPTAKPTANTPIIYGGT